MSKKKKQKARRQQQKRAARSAKRRRRTGRQKRPAISTRHPDDLPDQRTLVQGMMEMESLADEPEFADFELGEHATEIVVEMLNDSSEEMDRLEEIGDEEGLDRLVSEAKAEALQKVVTPAVKADIRRRLELLSRRLGREGQRQRAESIAALLQMLDFPPFPWALFEPVRQGLDRVVQHTLDFLLLEHSIADAAGRSLADLRPEELHRLLEDPEVANKLETLFETDELLRESIERQMERFDDEFADRLFTGEIDLSLFTVDDLALGIAWCERETEKAGIEWNDQEEESEEESVLRLRAYIAALDYLNTSDRRRKWRGLLEQVRAGRDWPPDIGVGLELFAAMLSDSPESGRPEFFLAHTYLSELNRTAEKAEADPDLEKELMAQVQRIKECLERGASPDV